MRFSAALQSDNPADASGRLIRRSYGDESVPARVDSVLNRWSREARLDKAAREWSAHTRQKKNFYQENRDKTRSEGRYIVHSMWYHRIFSVPNIRFNFWKIREKLAGLNYQAKRAVPAFLKNALRELGIRTVWTQQGSFGELFDAAEEDFSGAVALMGMEHPFLSLEAQHQAIARETVLKESFGQALRNLSLEKTGKLFEELAGREGHVGGLSDGVEDASSRSRIEIAWVRAVGRVPELSTSGAWLRIGGIAFKGIVLVGLAVVLGVAAVALPFISGIVVGSAAILVGVLNTTLMEKILGKINQNKNWEWAQQLMSGLKRLKEFRESDRAWVRTLFRWTIFAPVSFWDMRMSDASRQAWVQKKLQEEISRQREKSFVEERELAILEEVAETIASLRGRALDREYRRFRGLELQKKRVARLEAQKNAFEKTVEDQEEIEAEFTAWKKQWEAWGQSGEGAEPALPSAIKNHRGVRRWLDLARRARTLENDNSLMRGRNVRDEFIVPFPEVVKFAEAVRKLPTLDQDRMQWVMSDFLKLKNDHELTDAQFARLLTAYDPEFKGLAPEVMAKISLQENNPFHGLSVPELRLLVAPSRALLQRPANARKQRFVDIEEFNEWVSTYALTPEAYGLLRQLAGFELSEDQWEQTLLAVYGQGSARADFVKAMAEVRSKRQAIAKLNKVASENSEKIKKLQEEIRRLLAQQDTDQTSLERATDSLRTMAEEAERARVSAAMALEQAQKELVERFESIVEKDASLHTVVEAVTYGLGISGRFSFLMDAARSITNMLKDIKRDEASEQAAQAKGEEYESKYTPEDRKFLRARIRYLEQRMNPEGLVIAGNLDAAAMNSGGHIMVQEGFVRALHRMRWDPAMPGNRADAMPALLGVWLFHETGEGELDATLTPRAIAQLKQGVDESLEKRLKDVLLRTTGKPVDKADEQKPTGANDLGKMWRDYTANIMEMLYTRSLAPDVQATAFLGLARLESEWSGQGVIEKLYPHRNFSEYEETGSFEERLDKRVEFLDNYFRTVGVYKYLFAIRTALEQGDTKAALRILKKEEAKNYDKNGKPLEEPNISEYQIAEIRKLIKEIEAIPVLKDGKQRAIAWWEEVTGSAKDAWRLLSEESLLTAEERQQKYDSVREAVAAAIAQQTGRPEAEVLAEMDAWLAATDKRREDITGAQAEFLQQFGELGQDASVQQALVEALQSFKGAGMYRGKSLRDLKARDFNGAQVSEVDLPDGSKAVAVVIPKKQWRKFERGAGHNGALAFMEEPELFSAGLLSQSGILFVPSDYSVEVVAHETTHLGDLLTAETFSGEKSIGWIGRVEVLRELKAMTAQYKEPIEQGRLQEVLNTIFQQLVGKEKGNYFEQYCDLEGIPKADRVQLRPQYDAFVKDMLTQLGMMINAAQDSELVSLLLRGVRTPEDLTHAAAALRAGMPARSELRGELEVKVTAKSAPSDLAKTAAVHGVAGGEDVRVAEPETAAEPTDLTPGVDSRSRKAIVAQGKAEFEQEAPKMLAGFPDTPALETAVRGIALDMVGRLGLDVRVAPEFRSPAEDPRLVGHAGYYEEPDKAGEQGRIVLNNARVEALSQEIVGTGMLTPEQIQGLWNVIMDTMVAVAHENRHAEGFGEVEAYQVSLEMAEWVGLDQAKVDLLKVMLKLAKEEARTDGQQRLLDAIQLVERNGVMERRDAVEILGSLLNSKLYVFQDKDFGQPGLVHFDDVGALMREVEKAERAPASMQFVHNGVMVSDVNLALPEVNELLGRLAKRGYGIFVYTAGDKAQGVEQVFYVTQFAAWLGSDQFGQMIGKFYYEQKQGYFSVTAYLANKLIQTLLGEIVAQQQVGQAA